ncbi:MAG: PD40 domain-containing protein [Acidobacteria bacterium]|nr:PD40 domain-containing protein [Acidobacteriota bacterium]
MRNGTGGHMLLCPADANLVTYVHEPDRQNDMTLPGPERARTMIADFRTGQSRPYLIMPVGWRATHESRSPDGERFYFHKKKVPGWVPAGICSMKRDGGDWQTHLTSDYRLGHSMISADGRYIVSDVQKPGDNPLILVDLAKGSDRILCWPDSSVTGGHPKGAHVHPSFSPSSRYIVYTSDRTGTPQVYVVPVPR